MLQEREEMQLLLTSAKQQIAEHSQQMQQLAAQQFEMQEKIQQDMTAVQEKIAAQQFAVQEQQGQQMKEMQAMQHVLLQALQQTQQKTHEMSQQMLQQGAQPQEMQDTLAPIMQWRTCIDAKLTAYDVTLAVHTTSIEQQGEQMQEMQQIQHAFRSDCMQGMGLHSLTKSGVRARKCF